MRRFLRNLLMIICLAVFCYSGWQLYKIWAEYHTGDELYDGILSQVTEEPEEEEPEEEGETSGETAGSGEESVSGESAGTDQTDGAAAEDEDSVTMIDFDALTAINGDAIAWITVPGTKISYPVLKSADNNDYLRHTITGEANKAGCIFTDCRTVSAFEDGNTVIYGHNLLNGKMFSNLTKYQKKDFWLLHPYIYLQTKDGLHRYEIYSCYKTMSDSSVYTFGLKAGSAEYKKYLEKSVANALYETGVPVSENEKIITLSTCTNREEEERFVVHAVLAEE